MAEEREMSSRRRAARVMAVPPAAGGMSPREVLGVLRRHMALIIMLTIIGLAAGGGTCFLLRTYLPKYTARTYIEVLPPVQTDPMLITSPAHMVQRDIRYGHRLSIASMIKEQGMLQRLLERDTVRATSWYKRMGTLEKRVKYLKKYLGAYPHRDADYVEVSMTCRDSREAADIVNEMVAMFVDSQTNIKQGEVADRLKELEARRVAVQDELRQAEAALDDVRKAWQITDLRDPTTRYIKHTYTLQLDQLELQKNQLELAIKQLEADIKNFEELATGPIGVQVQHAIEIDPIMITLGQQLAFTEARLASMLTKFGENHKEVQELQELRDEILAKREERANEIGEQTRRANLENAKDRLVIFKERYAELERLRQEALAKQRDLDAARVQYENRLKVREERAAMLDEIKESIEKLKIMYGDPETPKVRRLADALEPLEMVLSRQWWVWFPTGTVVGFLLSLGLAFLIELANDLVRTPRDVTKYLNIPLLGVIPDAAADRELRGVDLARVVSQAPYSLLSESYRQCRTNLKLSGSGESIKTMLVTSGAAGDGKTCVAANLATAFVAEDKKVLLIDTNFRRPALAKLFPTSEPLGAGDEGLGVGFGLSSLLVGQCSARDAIRSSGIDGLEIIDAGLLPPNPAELLGSTRMQQLLQEQRDNYDYIIIDSPPVLLISDARVLAKYADATVLVFNAAATRRGAALRTIRELEELDANVVGCVLLGAPTLKGGYFQEQYKSYRRYQEKVQIAGASA